MFDFGRRYGEYPCCLHAFVDLRRQRLSPNGLPPNGSAKFPISPGLYAVVETTEKVVDEWDMSELLKPYKKIVDGNGERAFSLLDIESLAAPACVIPNLGEKTETNEADDRGDRYLSLYPREKWASLFGQWLMSKHEKLYAESPTKASVNEGEEEKEAMNKKPAKTKKRKRK